MDVATALTATLSSLGETRGATNSGSMAMAWPRGHDSHPPLWIS
jgi:hypothetical protein